MTKLIPSLGILGLVLGIAGLVVYSLDPEKLWVVTLSEGLALVCLIWFFVAHFATVKAFSARRSTQLGLNSILMVILVCGILVIINFLAARHSERWDLSETKRFTLAPQTYRVLRNLARDVKVTVFTQSNVYRDLLDSYRQASHLLEVEYVDPDRRPAIARQYGITRMDTAVFESGTRTTRVSVSSEAELTSALIRVSKDTKKRVTFLEGHGERDLNDEEPHGYSLVKETLTKQGYDVDTLLLLQASRVPEETSLLVVAGPQRPLTKAEKQRIASYVAEGGRLLILLDPQAQADLDNLLAEWGVKAGKGTLVDLQDRLAEGDLTSLMVRTFTEHEITQDFNSPVLFPTSRHLVFDETTGEQWDFVPLARTSARSWAETDLEALNSRVVNFNASDDVRGPLPLAAALSPRETPDEAAPNPAIVVVGNSAFASNAYVNFPGNTDFLLHTISWLAEERALISITPKEPAFRPFIPNPTQDRLLLYVQVFLLPTVTFLWGMTIWRKRRRL